MKEKKIANVIYHTSFSPWFNKKYTVVKFRTFYQSSNQSHKYNNIFLWNDQNICIKFLNLLKFAQRKHLHRIHVELSQITFHPCFPAPSDKAETS